MADGKSLNDAKVEAVRAILDAITKSIEDGGAASGVLAYAQAYNQLVSATWDPSKARSNSVTGY